MKLTPAIKGGITGALMIIVSVLVFNAGLPSGSPIHYLVFAIFGGGIIWALIAYKNSAAFTGKFGDLFNQGFRTFIIATLMIVIYTGVLVKTHPELSELEKKGTIEYYRKQGNKTEKEIEIEGERAKKNYFTSVIALTIPGFLVVGALTTALLSLTLTKRTS